MRKSKCLDFLGTVKFKVYISFQELATIYLSLGMRHIFIQVSHFLHQLNYFFDINQPFINEEHFPRSSNSHYPEPHHHSNR